VHVMDTPLGSLVLFTAIPHLFLYISKLTARQPAERFSEGEDFRDKMVEQGHTRMFVPTRPRLRHEELLGNQREPATVCCSLRIIDFLKARILWAEESCT